MMKLGTCGKNGDRYIVCWHEGDRITVPAVGCLIATYTRDRKEAIEICRRNLINFVEMKEAK